MDGTPKKDNSTGKSSLITPSVRYMASPLRKRIIARIRKEEKERKKKMTDLDSTDLDALAALDLTCSTFVRYVLLHTKLFSGLVFDDVYL